MKPLQKKADFTTHRIEGFTHTNEPISASLISHIEGNLWMGGCVNNTRLPDDFKYVISMYPWERYDLGPNTTRREFKMYDAGHIDLETTKAAAAYALECVMDGQTLIHCQAGLNRSGLVSTLVLIELGYEPQEAIDLLRDRRTDVVLCNRTFEAWLLEQK